jgi:hypothetical protein
MGKGNAKDLQYHGKDTAKVNGTDGVNGVACPCVGMSCPCISWLFSRWGIFALAVWNMFWYIARAGVAGHMFDHLVDGHSPHRQLEENNMTVYVYQTTMIGASIGFASCFVGVLHFKDWNQITRYLATGVGMVAFMLDFLVMGYAIKMLSMGCGTGTGCSASDLNGDSIFIASAVIVQFFFKGLYVFVVYTTYVHTPEEYIAHTSLMDKFWLNMTKAADTAATATDTAEGGVTVTVTEAEPKKELDAGEKC